MAYFVGEDPEFTNDNGFALKPWEELRYDNDEGGAEEVMVTGNIGFTMGPVYLKDKEENGIFAEMIFEFKKPENGKERLIIHKPALSFNL